MKHSRRDYNTKMPFGINKVWLLSKLPSLILRRSQAHVVMDPGLEAAMIEEVAQRADDVDLHVTPVTSDMIAFARSLDVAVLIIEAGATQMYSQTTQHGGGDNILASEVDAAYQLLMRSLWVDDDE